MEMSKDVPPAEYPQSNNNFAMQEPSAYPPQPYQPPPPAYDAQQYPAVEPQPAAVQIQQNQHDVESGKSLQQRIAERMAAIDAQPRRQAGRGPIQQNQHDVESGKSLQQRIAERMAAIDAQPRRQAGRGPVVIRKQPDSGGDVPQSFLKLSVSTLILTVLCAWPLLICSIPALLFSIMSRDRASRGEYETARTYSILALVLNTLALVSFVVIVIVIIVVEVA